MKKILVTAIAIALTGCTATMSAAPAGQYTIDKGASFNLTEAWTHVPESLHASKGSILTKDGMALNRIHILTVEDGEEMIIIRDKSQEYPIYNNGSSPLKQVEFLTSNLSRLGFEGVEAKGVAPAKISGLDGTRLDLGGQYKSGLNMKGVAVMAESSVGLNMIIYVAPVLHYYSRDIDEVNTLIDSVNFP